MIVLFVFQCLSGTLMYYNRKYGMRASGVLFFFWLLLILAGLPQLRSEIMSHNKLDDDENVRYNFVSYVVYFTLIVIMFVLNCFADLPPKDTPYKITEKVIISFIVFFLILLDTACDFVRTWWWVVFQSPWMEATSRDIMILLVVTSISWYLYPLLCQHTTGIMKLVFYKKIYQFDLVSCCTLQFSVTFGL